MSTISTHVLDTSRGKPAAGIAIELSLVNTVGVAHPIHAATTDADGRVKTLNTQDLQAGTYKMRFQTAEYFANQGLDGFYPHVEIYFTVKEKSEHYHVPLLLSPFGFSTYRGS